MRVLPHYHATFYFVSRLTTTAEDNCEGSDLAVFQRVSSPGSSSCRPLPPNLKYCTLEKLDESENGTTAPNHFKEGLCWFYLFRLLYCPPLEV